MLPENNILFKGVDPADCQRMMSCFSPEIKQYKAGSRIIDFSESSDKVGIILSGRAVMERYDINGVRTIIESLGEQGIFGVFFTFSTSPRNHIEIVSETDCKIMFLRRSEITKRCENACSCHSMVVENLLGNIDKYAREDTDVYITLTQADGKASVSFRNESAVEITASAASLKERFGRGDESRRTEGFGLGLSIADSLPSLMGGTFDVIVSRTQFEAVMTFPVLHK